jgi:phosphohistidine phosphatase
MDLILWRHAEAHALPEEQAADPQADLQRALTSKGERQAQRMAEWLNRRLPESTRILVSPAVRTQQTALALARPFRTVKALAPDAPAEAVLQAARWPDASEPVLIVGHQPTLGAVAARLLAGLDHSWAIKKAGVWWLRSRQRGEDAGVVLQAVQTVEFL